MEVYTCPMHPEVRQDKAGNCPKCGGMKLVPLDSLKAKVVSQNENGSIGISDVAYRGLAEAFFIVSILYKLEIFNFYILPSIDFQKLFRNSTFFFYFVFFSS